MLFKCDNSVEVIPFIVPENKIFPSISIFSVGSSLFIPILPLDVIINTPSSPLQDISIIFE